MITDKRVSWHNVLYYVRNWIWSIRHLVDRELEETVIDVCTWISAVELYAIVIPSDGDVASSQPQKFQEQYQNYEHRTWDQAQD